MCVHVGTLRDMLSCRRVLPVVSCLVGCADRIPEQLGELSALQDLNLSNNRLSGEYGVRVEGSM